MDAPLLVDQLRTGAPHLSVGILTADLLSLGHDLAVVQQAGVRIVHIDVMDGCFCPMMTVGPPLIKAVKTPMLKDVHLMITDPLEKIGDYVAAGADIVVFQVEGARQPHRVLQVLAKATNANDPDRGIVRGVALNPSTPLQAVEPLLDDVELILLLAVNPGWGGQQMIATTAGRFAALAEMVRNSGRHILLGIDGGVTCENLEGVLAMGPDIIVAGSAVFDGKSPAGNAGCMLQLIESSRS